MGRNITDTNRYSAKLDESWDHCYRELEEYKIENGDCIVPQKTDIGKWVASQREAKRKGVLKRSRAEKLEEIDFQWKAHNHTWDIKCEELVKYKIENEDFNVQRGSVLYNWVNE